MSLQTLTQANFQVIIRVRPLNSKQQQQIQAYEYAQTKKFKSPKDTKTIKLSPMAYAFYTKFYNIQSLNEIVKVQNTTTINVLDTEYKNTQKKLKPYIFSHVYGQRQSSGEIFEQSILSQLECIFDGFNYTILAYGITGSGKTHTVFGSYEKSQPGICGLAMNYLLAKKQQLQSQQQAKVILKFSFIEIYNQNVRDLLSPEGKMLNIIEDTKGNTTFVDATQIFINNQNQINEMIALGLQKRSSSATMANQYSSRSHAVLQMAIQIQKVNGQKVISKMFIVDLAGSQKIQTLNTAKKMLQGANINKSLLALGNCINILAQNSRKGLLGSTSSSHIPYRDSKLTRILKDSLGGNAKTLMIACVSENPFTIQQTITTLNYAQRAQVIKKQVKKNNNRDDDGKKALCSRCMGELSNEDGQFNLRPNNKILLPKSLLCQTTTKQKSQMLTTFFEQIYEDIVQNIKQKFSIQRYLMASQSRNYQSNSSSSSELLKLKEVNENQRIQLKQTMWKIFVQKQQLYDQKLTQLNQFIEKVNHEADYYTIQDQSKGQNTGGERTLSRTRGSYGINDQSQERRNSQVTQSSQTNHNRLKKYSSKQKARSISSSRYPLQSRINNQQNQNLTLKDQNISSNAKTTIDLKPLPIDQNSNVRFSFASLLTSDVVSKVQQVQNYQQPGQEKQKSAQKLTKRKKSRSKFQVVKRMSTSKLESKQMGQVSV